MCKHIFMYKSICINTKYKYVSPLKCVFYRNQNASSKSNYCEGEVRFDFMEMYFCKFQKHKYVYTNISNQMSNLHFHMYICIFISTFHKIHTYARMDKCIKLDIKSAFCFTYVYFCMLICLFHKTHTYLCIHKYIKPNI